MTRNADPASLTIAKRIDAHCDRFEAEWRAGRQPRLEAFLGDAKSPERSQLFRALLAVELELLLKAGRPLDPGPYQKRFPDQAAAIEAVIREVGGAAGSVEDLASRDTSVSRSDAARRSEQATGSYQGSAAPGASPATPQKIGRFEILAVLGEGAFGKVYRARDPHLDREVAIKVPLAGTLEKDRDLERFLREARAAATIRHANICPVYEVGQDGSIHYIVMAFVPGQSLAANLASRKEPLPQRQAALIVRKLALALEAAHAQGIIHRDLKPTNIMFDRDRKDLVVMDFGLARRVRKDEAQLTQSGMIMGTPSYMAPEQACGDVAAIGPWSDVYSLGVIFYEMLTGRRPFTGSVAEVLGKLLHVEPEPPSKLRPDVDPRLEAICLKAMAKDPKQRYQSMKELAAALNDSTKVAIPEAKPVTASVTAPGTEMVQFAEMVQAMSAERKAEVAAAVRRARTPFWMWLAAGAGFLAAVVLLGLFFFVNTGPATVIIHVPLPEGVSLKDAALSFFLDGKAIAAAELEKPVPLSVGDHELLIKRGDQVLKRLTFAVRLQGKEAKIEIKEEQAPPPPPTGPQPPPDRSVRLEPVRELNTAADEAYSWLVPDGRTIYFTREGNTARPGIYRAQRANAGAPFGAAEYVCSARHVALAADERFLVALGTGLPANLFQKVRASAAAPVEPLALIEELKDQANPKSPWLSADGLVLVFQRQDAAGDYPGKPAAENGQSTELVLCQRASAQAAWSVPQRLPLLDDPLYTAPLTWPMLTDDRLTLFFCNGGTRSGAEVLYATRDSVDKPFGNPQKVLINGQPLLGRSPRFVAATRELFVDRDLGTKDAPRDIDLWVVKNFEPTRKAGPGPSLEPSPGFEPLFNGKDLAGWQRGPGSTANWLVLDGMLVGTGPPGHLFSDRGDFEDFHLRVETQINAGGNSGVYFRAPLAAGFPDAYEAQINSTARDPIKTGSLFPRFNPNLTDAQKAKILVLEAPVKPDEWFTQEIIVQGNHIIIKINGKVTVDFVDENNTYRRGHFALQQHHDGSIVRFRKIEIKELKAVPATAPVPAPPAGDGFKPLFNGQDLAGWDGLPGHWRWDRGELIGRSPAGQSSHTFLCSQKKYRDFELHFDARLIGERCNSGVQLRSVIRDRNRFTTYGPQIEISNGDSGAPPGSLVTEPKGEPSVRADWPGVEKVLKVGDWNSYTLKVVGSHVTITVNGLTTVDADFSMDPEGIIAWQIHSNMKDKEVRFRNIRIKAADPAPRCAAATPAPRLDDDKTHESFVETAKKGGIDVLFLGDSITAGWRGAAKVWGQHFEPLKAAHFGVGGDRTQHLLWRILNGELEGIQPKVAVVMIGTNNSSSDTAADIAEGIEAIVTTIREKSPNTKVLLVAIFPRGNPLANPQNDRLTEVNKLIAKLDNGSTVRFMHINARFLGADGQIAKELMPDFLHLSPRGYEIWAAAMMPLLNEMLVEKPAAWQPLFNGKDLTGWQGLAPYWKVVKGDIVGGSALAIPFNTYLCSTRKYQDFELRFQARLKDGLGNSGVQIRSVVFDPAKQVVLGPQVDIGGTFWGSLYGEKFAGTPYIAGQPQAGSMMKTPDAAALARAAVKPNEFNDFFIRCVGKHVTIQINGETTVDGEFPQMYTDGVIAWQIHAGKPMEVTFRKVEIRELK